MTIPGLIIPVSTTNGHCSNTTDFVNVLEWQTQWFVSRSCWGNNSVQSFQKSGTLGISFLTGDFPSLVPSHVGGGVQHVIAVPSGNWDKSDSSRVITDFLNEIGNFLGDFFETSLGVWRLGGVHFVDTNNELFDTQSIGKVRVHEFD